MLDTRGLFPFVRIEARKERIGAFDGRIDPRQVHVRRVRQRECEDLTAADHRELLVAGDSDRLVERMHDALAGIRRRVAARHDEILPAGQWTPDRDGGLAAHQYGLAERQRLEALQIVRKMPRHCAVAADGEVAVERYDQRNLHGAIVAAARSPVSRASYSR